MKKEYEFLEKIMGTDLSISIICDDQKIAKEMSAKILYELQEYEKKFSRFIPDSELSIINDKKKLKVSDNFIEVILEAKEMFKETKGFFNPLLQISNYGYNESFELLNNVERYFAIRKCDINFDSVIIDTEKNIITLGRNQKLDFGGFLKGFLAEKIARKYFNISKNITGIVINIGGDIYTMGLDENNKMFEFSIYNPVTNVDDLIVPLFNSGLATSGTYKRKWKSKGKDFNHILDKSGKKNPETENVSVSIINESGARADTYTKLFLSNKPKEALEIIGNKDSKTKYIIINKKGEITQNIK